MNLTSRNSPLRVCPALVAWANYGRRYSDTFAWWPELVYGELHPLYFHLGHDHGLYVAILPIPETATEDPRGVSCSICCGTFEPNSGRSARLKRIHRETFSTTAGDVGSALSIAISLMSLIPTALPDTVEVGS